MDMTHRLQSNARAGHDRLFAFANEILKVAHGDDVPTSKTELLLFLQRQYAQVREPTRRLTHWEAAAQATAPSSTPLMSSPSRIAKIVSETLQQHLAPLTTVVTQIGLSVSALTGGMLPVTREVTSTTAVGALGPPLPRFNGTSSRDRRVFKVPPLNVLKTFRNVDLLWNGRYEGYPALRDFYNVTTEWVTRGNVPDNELKTQRSMHSKIATVARRIEELQREGQLPEDVYRQLETEYRSITSAYNALKGDGGGRKRKRDSADGSDGDGGGAFLVSNRDAEPTRADRVVDDPEQPTEAEV